MTNIGWMAVACGFVTFLRSMVAWYRDKDTTKSDMLDINMLLWFILAAILLK